MLSPPSGGKIIMGGTIVITAFDMVSVGCKNLHQEKKMAEYWNADIINRK